MEFHEATWRTDINQYPGLMFCLRCGAQINRREIDVIDLPPVDGFRCVKAGPGITNGPCGCHFDDRNSVEFGFPTSQIR